MKIQTIFHHFKLRVCCIPKVIKITEKNSNNAFEYIIKIKIVNHVSILKDVAKYQKYIARPLPQD